MGIKYKFKLFLIILFCIAPVGLIENLNAQQPIATQINREDQKNNDVENGDVVITANVTAKELKFEVVPNPTVEFPVSRQRKNIWEAERVNLPPTVEPGVTYRDIGIRLRIVSRFAEIDRIVAEALGEIPVDDKPLQPEKIAPPPPSTSPTPPRQINPPKH